MAATSDSVADAESPSIVVVDYGLGNLRSVTRGLERAGASVAVREDPVAIEQADGVVLPGVGAFREGVENAGPYREALLAAAADGTPIFGICLGMQMLLTSSEEATRAGQGDVTGLDLIPGRNVRFDFSAAAPEEPRRKIPHMGWNQLEVQREHPLVTGVDSEASTTPRGNGTVGGSVDGEYAYFVHSYYAQPADEDAIVATTDYGEAFPSVIANEAGTVFGTQFHPEKSGAAGLRILENFVGICRLANE
jgi:glutamine amidotransferase